MQYWLFKIENSGSITALKNNEDIEYLFPIRTRDIGIEEEDKLILMINNNQKGWSFEHSGEVTSKDVDIKENNEQKEITLTIGNVRNISSPNALDDFAYTLAFVKNFKEPMKNFTRNPYKKVSKAEYEAIINNRIFISRTIFGKTINALHLDFRIGFIQNILQKDQKLYLDKKDYMKLFSIFSEYLITRLLTPSNMFREAYQSFTQVFEATDAEKLEFVLNNGDYPNGNYPIINASAKIRDINALMGISPFLFLEELKASIEESSTTERELDKIFKNLPLPIQTT